jgi:hypothetical protein
MSFLDVYIGDLDDPTFSWDGANWEIGNVPHSTSPYFPPPVPFGRLIDNIHEGKLVGKQTEWGGSVARARKAEIRAFIDESYSGSTLYAQPTPLEADLVEQMRQLLAFVDSLDDHKQYALVAVEI